MRFAIADPPYPGMAQKHYADHADFAGEVDHTELIAELQTFDAAALHTNSSALHQLLPLCPPNVRVLCWVKSFAAWKRNVYPAYAWEPVLTFGARNRYGEKQTPPDFIVEPMTLRKGLAGAKPERVCWWVFECLGVEPDDELHDLFPGTGAITEAWGSWRRQTSLAFPSSPDDEPLFEDVA